VECSAVLATRNRHKKSVAYSVIILVAKFLCSNGLTFVLGIVILAFSAVRVLDSALFSSDVGHAESRHPLSRGSVGSCTGVYQVGLLRVDPLWISRVKTLLLTGISAMLESESASSMSTFGEFSGLVSSKLAK